MSYNPLLNPMAILFVLVWNGAKTTYTTNVSSTLGDTNYRKIPKISPSKYKPPKLETQKPLR